MKHHRTFNQYIINLLALVSGLIVPLSLAPYNLSFLALISTTTLIFCLFNSNLKQSAINGYLYGLGLFGAGVWWLYVSIHEHGNASPILAFSLTATLIAGFLAFYPALKLLVCRYFLNTKPNTIQLLIFVPSLWVITDWMQGWLLTGFPWLYLGYSQTSTHLSGFAPIISVFGLTWLVVFISFLLYLCLENIINFVKNNNNQFTLNNCLSYIFIIAALYIIGDSLKYTHWTHKNSRDEQVVLVQGNIAQQSRWQPNQYEQNILTYESLTAPYWSNSTIIWPESSISIPLPYSNSLIEKWHVQAKDSNSTLILGIPKLANSNKQYFNSIIAVGGGSGSYNKNKLVPWGEYVPLENILRGLISFFDLPMSNFISGNNETPHFNILNSNAIKWLPFICYEIAYPNYVINHAARGEAIVTISNDAWFGNSIGPWQHLQLAQMRALETGRPVARSTNNGITAIIDPNGSITNKINQFEAGVLVDKVSGYSGFTPIMIIGINAIISLCFILVFASVISCYHLRRHKISQAT